jgi:hypothetical protein
MTYMRAIAGWLLISSSLVLSAACGDGRPYEVFAYSEGFRISAAPDSVPPHAQDDLTWRVRVQDAKTGQPIEGGEGMVWARTRNSTHEVRARIEQAPELGLYRGKLMLVMAGDWQMGVQFRRDSTSPWASLDWIQSVKAPRPLGG